MERPIYLFVLICSLVIPVVQIALIIFVFVSWICSTHNPCFILLIKKTKSAASTIDLPACDYMFIHKSVRN